jgi:hypothetical protein
MSDVRARIESLERGYSPDERRPVTSYAKLASVYGATVVAFGVAVRLSGRRLPERVDAGDVVLMAVATHKLSRLISKDRVTAFLRAPFTRFQEEVNSSTVVEKPRGDGIQRVVGELVGCPFCLSQWVATGFGYGLVLAPRATRLAMSVFTALAAADYLHYAYAAAEKAAG